MHEITGDILRIQAGIVCHQVNCKGKAGAGLALSIRRAYPHWYRHFQATAGVLGRVDLYRVNDVLSIASLYAQDGYGRAQRRYTDYPALARCLAQLAAAAAEEPIYIPRGMGCGLAGGEWPVVEAMIARHLPWATIIRYETDRRNA